MWLPIRASIANVFSLRFFVAWIFVSAEALIPFHSLPCVHFPFFPFFFAPLELPLPLQGKLAPQFPPVFFFIFCPCTFVSPELSLPHPCSYCWHVWSCYPGENKQPKMNNDHTRSPMYFPPNNSTQSVVLKSSQISPLVFFWQIRDRGIGPGVTRFPSSLLAFKTFATLPNCLYSTCIFWQVVGFLIVPRYCSSRCFFFAFHGIAVFFRLQQRDNIFFSFFAELQSFPCHDNGYHFFSQAFSGKWTKMT